MIEININPIAFTLGSIEVRWYGIFIALAIGLIILWTLREIRRGANISADTVFTAALVGISSGIVFSRLLHVVDFWGYYSQNPGQIIGGSGLTIYGAVLGATLGIWVYSKFGKFQFAYLADVVTPAVILAQVVGRVGCTINGCCYGTPTYLPWGIIYIHPDSLAPLGIATHPVVVYEMIYLLVMFGVILRLKGRLKPEGSLFLVYLGLYSLWRLGIDFLRQGTPFLFGLHQAQVIAIIVLIIIIPWSSYRTRWVKVK